MTNVRKTPPVQEKTFVETILRYIKILWRYKIMIFSITGAAAVSVVIFSVISLKLPPEKSPMPNIYRAYATVVFQAGGTGSAGVSSMLAAFGVDEPSGNISSQAQLAIQILGSRAFIDSIVEEFNIIQRYGITDSEKTRSRRIIEHGAEYIYDQNGGTLTIAYTSSNPVFAADVVNSMVHLLEEWFRREGVTTQSTQLARMRETLDDLSAEIARIEADIEAFQRELGVLDIRELALTQSTMLTDLQTLLNQVELEISDYSEYSTFEDPALTTLKNRRDNILTQIRRIQNGYISSAGQKMPSLEEMPRLSLDFAHMQAELALRNQLYQSLSELYEITRLTGSESEMFTVLELAEVPEEKEGPLRGEMCIKVFFAAFLFSIVLAFFLNYAKDKLKKPLKEIFMEEDV